VQFPFVQTKIVTYLSEELSQLTGFDISLEKISIDWLDQIDVRGIKVIDPGGNRLFYSQKAIINFDIRSLVDKSNRNLDEITVYNSDLYFTKIAISDSVNTLNVNALIKKIRRAIRKQSKSRKFFSVDEVYLKNISLTYYENDSAQSMREGLDYRHFSVENIYGDFSNLKSMSDTLEVSVDDLSAKEFLSGLTLNNLKTDFHLSQTSMRFDDMALEIGDSYITDQVVFNYSSTSDLSDFVDKVYIDANLKNSTINTRDLALFTPYMSKYKDKYKLSGQFKGKIKAFSFNDASIRLGQNSIVRGRVRMTGLPYFDETFIDSKFNDSFVTVTDLNQYLNTKTYSRLEPLLRMSFNASFIGFPNDFVTKGYFNTPLGKIDTDINLKVSNNINLSKYSGKLQLTDFDVGGYTENQIISKVTLNGEIEGTGFTLENADFLLNGNISKIGLNGYDYRSITTDARFTKEFFEGFLKVDDPNLKLKTTGSIDLRAGINFFNINAEIDTVNFKEINLSKEPFFLSSNVTVNAKGLALDSITGKATMTNTFAVYKENELRLDSLQVFSLKENNQRKLSVLTNLTDIIIEGDFNYTNVYNDFTTLVKEYKLNLDNNKDSLDNYYATKKPFEPGSQYSLDYKVRLKNPNPLFELFAPNWYVSKGADIQGNFISGYTSILSANTAPDTLIYKDNVFSNNEMQLNVSKISDSTSVLGMVYATSENQKIGGVATKSMFFEGIWNKNHIDYEFDIDQLAYNNYAKILGEIDFYTDTTSFHFKPSEIQILDKMWSIDENNLVRMSDGEMEFSELRVYSGSQNIAFNGIISKNPEKKLDVLVENLKLENFNPIIKQKLTGIINGSATIKDFYNDLFIESRINTTDLTVDDFLVGNINGSNIWISKNKRFRTDFDVTRMGDEIVKIGGTYTPGMESPLNLKAQLKQTELKILEPFFDKYFSNVKGSLTGELDITGKLSKPIFEGEGIIESAGLSVDYLKTDYNFDGKFYFVENAIGFEDIQITDNREGDAKLQGVFNHHNFKDFFIDIGGDFNNLLLLNTTSNDNDLFYGEGIGTGSINFIGPVSNLNIVAQAKTEKDTKIYIPIGDSETIKQEEFINFVDFKDTTQVATITEEIKKVDLKGLKLNFDLDITPDAYTEIIFDIKAGDIIRGRGNGEIKLQIDTKGEFNMFGDFAIQEGGYNFTLYNIINKEFDILPNSTISWYGDPYEGILDINASYNQLASLLPLMVQQENDTIYQESTEIRRKYPVKVLLDINGPLLSPAVNFDITAQNLPRNVPLPNGEVKDLEFEFLAFKNRIDEQELKRQVFSLIILRRFSPYQSFNTGGSITSSVSELFSNQLSYWITQVDENLEIDVDLGLLDEEAFNTFQLRLSYTFLDGRLRFTRDGGFTNQANRADVSSIAGDWTVEYLLTPDGKFKVKMYNRTNYNPINPNQDNQNTITTGFSLIHTQSFNELRDLFRKSRNNAQQRIEEESDDQEKEESDTSVKNNQEAIKEENDSE